MLDKLVQLSQLLSGSTDYRGYSTQTELHKSEKTKLERVFYPLSRTDVCSNDTVGIVGDVTEFYADCVLF